MATLTKQQINKQNKSPAYMEPKKCSAMDSSDVRNLAALFENEAGTLVIEMIKNLLL